MPADGVPLVSPIRSGALEVGQPAPAAGSATPVRDVAAPVPGPLEPVPGSLEPPDLAELASEREEPPYPDEARSRALAPATGPTVPVEAGPGGRLHVRFAGATSHEALVGAMSAVRDTLGRRPGQTRVTVHLPQGPGRPALPMELRSGVAYDAELVAELGRRLGPGIVELELAPDSGPPPSA